MPHPPVPAQPPWQLVLTVWYPAKGEFRARAVMADGSLRDFDSPFELARFLYRPPPASPLPSGLR
ncbi:MAG: hypothetical protein KDG57_09830 [Rhodoferax sp.]|nr:hypothetical protein [Rhodoferax sp.]